MVTDRGGEPENLQRLQNHGFGFRRFTYRFVVPVNFRNSNFITIRLAIACLAMGRLLAALEGTAVEGIGATEGGFGVQEFVLSAQAAGGELVLNEVVSSNQDSLRDEDGDSPDWIELFNGGNAPVSLAGCGLSDDPNRPFRWVFPVTTLGPRSYLVVFASGKDRRTPGSPLHTDFQVQASGEPVLLTRPDGTRQDLAVGVRLREDVSWGRFPNGTGAWKYFAVPTPRRSNSVQTAYDSIVFAAPAVTPDSGFYADPVAATLSLAEGDTVLRYTLDGAEPDESSPVYAGPLGIRSRAGEPNVLSLIRGTSTANQHTDGWKAPSGEVRKATVLRTRATRAGAIPGPVVTRTYFVGADAARVDGLPTLALTTDPDGLFDYDRGIYMLGAIFDRYVAAHPGEGLTGHTPANYTQRGGEWERPAQLEWFEPDGRRAFGEPVTVDIQGQSSRSFRQKSFGVKAENSFVHAIFPGLTRLGGGTPLQEFRNLRLRNMGNDWDYALMRDDWCHRLASGLGLNIMASRYVSLYLDGEYWGILAAREQQDARYLQAHYGMDPSEVVILHAAGSLEEGLPGDETPWLDLLKFCQTHDLSVPSNYEYVAARLDPQDALLYYLAEIYFANADWPQNNMRVWRRRLDVPDASLGRGLDGRWRWFLFDVDLGVAHPWSAGVNDNTLSAALSPTGRPGFDSTWGTAVIRALMTRPEWKREFITTAADLLNSWYSPNRATALVETMRGELRPAMDEHIRRWRSNGGNVAAWETHVRSVRDFATQRAARVRAHVLAQFQLGGQSRLTLDVNDAVRGRVRINRLLVDASLPGVNAAPYPWTGVYFNTVPVTLEAVAAPGWQFDGWTGLAAPGPIASWTPGGNLQVTARFVALPAVIREAAMQGNSVRLRITGTPGASYAIQGADDLLLWVDAVSFTCGADGQAEVQVPMVAGESRRFLRALAH
jgi:CotH kinase protein/Lamin Tail Domain/Chitobiase/beta-hexosaminidase C-terminal domain